MESCNTMLLRFDKKVNGKETEKRAGPKGPALLIGLMSEDRYRAVLGWCNDILPAVHESSVGIGDLHVEGFHAQNGMANLGQVCQQLLRIFLADGFVSNHVGEVLNTVHLQDGSIQTIRPGPPSAAINFLEEMKCLAWPMKPGV